MGQARTSVPCPRCSCIGNVAKNAGINTCNLLLLSYNSLNLLDTVRVATNCTLTLLDCEFAQSGLAMRSLSHDAAYLDYDVMRSKIKSSNLSKRGLIPGHNLSSMPDKWVCNFSSCDVMDISFSLQCKKKN